NADRGEYQYAAAALRPIALAVVAISSLPDTDSSAGRGDRATSDRRRAASPRRPCPAGTGGGGDRRPGAAAGERAVRLASAGGPCPPGPVVQAWQALPRGGTRAWRRPPGRGCPGGRP